MKNQIFTLILMAIIAVSLSSCKKDNKADPAEELSGSWVLQKSETSFTISGGTEEALVRDYAAEEQESTIVITEDGQITVRDWNELEETHDVSIGTYEIRDGKIYASIDADSFPFENGFDYTIDGNALTVSVEDTVYIEALDITAEVEFKATTIRFLN